MIHASTITEEDRRFVETWQNVGLAQIGIVKVTARGDIAQQLISGPRRFMVTTEERLLTQEKITSSANDPFLNGSFRPIHVPPQVTVESNPNALSDEDIVAILQGSDLAWDEWMKVIDSPETLARMLVAAEETTCSLRRFRQIEGRLSELKPPKKRIVQKDRVQFESMGGGA